MFPVFLPPFISCVSLFFPLIFLWFSHQNHPLTGDFQCWEDSSWLFCADHLPVLDHVECALFKPIWWFQPDIKYQTFCIHGYRWVGTSIYIIYISKHVYTYFYIYSYTYFIYTYVCIYTYIYIYTHTYIHTCMHACMHASIHPYIHTYIYIYICVILNLLVSSW
jgi:hypothetical protein